MKKLTYLFLLLMCTISMAISVSADLIADPAIKVGNSYISIVFLAPILFIVLVVVITALIILIIRKKK